jgi:DNA-binding transcriptional ArsR family regulator
MKRKTDTVFGAISDPTRRRIIDLLAKQERSVKELTRNFDVSQPAISQHLRALRESNLVRSKRVGTEQMYRLTADPLAGVFRWVSQHRMLFDPAGHAWSFAPAKQGGEGNGN